MEQELISITVWLAGRSYRLKVKPDEESSVRKAVKLADDKVNEMRTHYAGKDDQDFIGMTLLTYAADTAIDIFNNPVLRDEMDKLVKKIDRAL